MSWAIELGLVKESQNRKSKKFLIKRVFAIILIGVLFGFIVFKFNGADTFFKDAVNTIILSYKEKNNDFRTVL